MKYLLDTAPWINGITLPHLLPPRIRRLLQNEETKGLCTVSLSETAILHRLGRLKLEATLEEFFTAGLSEDLQLLDITPTIAAGTNAFSEDFQGDPFDRTIAATAAIMNLTLITTDTAIRDARVCSVEYYPFRASRRAAKK